MVRIAEFCCIFEESYDCCFLALSTKQNATIFIALWKALDFCLMEGRIQMYFSFLYNIYLISYHISTLKKISFSLIFPCRFGKFNFSLNTFWTDLKFRVELTPDLMLIFLWVNTDSVLISFDTLQILKKTSNLFFLSVLANATSVLVLFEHTSYSK